MTGKEFQTPPTRSGKTQAALETGKSVAIAGSGVGLGITMNWIFKMKYGTDMPTDVALFISGLLVVGMARVWRIIRLVVLRKWNFDLEG